VSQAFVALPLTPSDSAPFAPGEIRIELRRAGVSIGVAWPVSAASQCAAWLRELLR
jgi:transposase